MDADGRQAWQRALGSFTAVWAVVAVFTVVCLWRVWSLASLHDEGLLTWHFGALVAHEPAAGLFFQKARPGIAPFYAPVSLLGFEAFATLHVLVAAAAIAALADLARRYGHAFPVVAAFAMASSSLYVMGASAGHTNTDGVAALVLGLWLWDRDRLIGAGVVIGMIVFMRSEGAVFVLALAGWAVHKRAWRVLVALAVFPVVYGLAGSVYHRDVLWMLHFPPALPAPPLESAHWREAVGARTWLAESGGAALALIPVGGLLVALRPTALRDLERPMMVGAIVYIAAIRLFPLFGWFNFDQSPRYMMLALPALALALSRTLTHLTASDAAERPTEGRLAFALLVVAAAVCGLNRATAGDWTLLAVASAAAALAALRADRPLLGLGVGVLAPAALCLPLMAHSRLRPPLEDLARAAEFIERTALGDVVTNEPLLGFYLDRRGGTARTAFIVQADTRAELDRLLNADVGQDQAVFRALDLQFFGTLVDPDELDPLDHEPGTIVVWTADDRLGQTLDLAAWNRHTHWLYRGPRLRVGQLQEAR